MMFPRIFSDDLFDDFMSMPFDVDFDKLDKRLTKHNPIFGRREQNMMKTDIKEKDGNYVIDMDLPGCKKEDVALKLDNGYITISANRAVDKDEKDDNGSYIRRERYMGSCSRSFYVGTRVQESDIKAKFDSGILHIEVPTEKINNQVEGKGYIAIEG